MFIALIVLLCLALFLIHLAVSGLLLWLGCKVALVPGATYRQAFVAAAISFLLGAALAAAVAYAIPFSRMDVLEAVAVQLALLVVVNLIIPQVCIRVQWPVSFSKSLLIWVLWTVFSVAYGTVVVAFLWVVGRQLAEPFVIPTGAMAETLLGYHKDVTCPECGYRFPINCSQEAELNLQGPLRVDACTCPNCRLTIGLRTRGNEGRGSKVIEDPGLASGDRILVNKSRSAPLGRRLERFDLVVFRYPGDPAAGGAPSPQQPVNYVKRLVGIGPETVGIHGGDVYLMPGELPPERGEADAGLIPPALTREDEHADLLRDGDPRFQIQRKPPELVLALRKLVYDNDHPARDLEGKPPRWAADEDGAWAAAEPRGFRHTPPGDDRLRWLRYRHLLRDQGDRPRLITNFFGYNTYRPRLMGMAPPTHDWVGDLILECEITVDDPKGEFALELSRGAERFRALFRLAAGECRLLRLNQPHTDAAPPADDAFQQLTSNVTALRERGTYRLRFANVDQRLTVWVDDALPFGEGITCESVRKKGPYPNDLQPASIGASGGTIRVHQIKLWRDVYCTTRPGMADAVGDEEEVSDPDKWEPLRNPPAKTYYVQPGHYFCLGDNSIESSDSRHWGLVPEANLLGRPVMIYYPFSRSGPIR